MSESSTSEPHLPGEAPTAKSQAGESEPAAEAEAAVGSGVGVASEREDVGGAASGAAPRHGVGTARASDSDDELATGARGAEAEPVAGARNAGAGIGAQSAQSSTEASGSPVEAFADSDEAASAVTSEPGLGDTTGEATVDATGAGGEVSALLAQRDAHLADLQRVSAEFANFRRQTAKRHADTLEQAASRLVSSLLPVLDTCEAAASQGVEGIEAVRSQLLGVLSNEGLSVLGAAGEPFDPNCHEAVMAEAPAADDSDADVVAEVLRTGYAWKGRVLRAAMVRVRR